MLSSEKLKVLEERVRRKEIELTKRILSMNSMITFLKLKDSVKNLKNLPKECGEWLLNLKSLYVNSEIEDDMCYSDIEWEFKLVDENNNLINYQYRREQYCDKHGVTDLKISNNQEEKIEWDFFWHGELHDDVAEKTIEMLRLSGVALGHFFGMLHYVVDFIARENEKEYKLEFYTDWNIIKY